MSRISVWATLVRIRKSPISCKAIQSVASTGWGWQVFVLAIFVSHIALASAAVGIFPKKESIQKAKLSTIAIDDSKTPLSSSIPQQLSLEELLVLDDDNEENELTFSTSLSSNFHLFEVFSNIQKSAFVVKNSFFANIPLYLLFKSWKAFLYKNIIW